ncbi:6544_t:CDS:2, partial [Racocetra persica]
TLNYRLLQDAVNEMFPDTISEETRKAHVTLVLEELCKLFISQCANLKSIQYIGYPSLSPYIIAIPSRSIDPIFIDLCGLPGAEACLSKLQSFEYGGNIPIELLHAFSRVVKELESLTITSLGDDNEGLIALIDAQTKLQHVKIHAHENIPNIISAIQSKTETIKKVSIIGRTSILLDDFCGFSNLEELTLELLEFPYNRLSRSSLWVTQAEKQEILRRQREFQQSFHQAQIQYQVQVAPVVQPLAQQQPQPQQVATQNQNQGNPPQTQNQPTPSTSPTQHLSAPPASHDTFQDISSTSHVQSQPTTSTSVAQPEDHSLDQIQDQNADQDQNQSTTQTQVQPIAMTNTPNQTPGGRANQVATFAQQVFSLFGTDHRPWRNLYPSATSEIECYANSSLTKLHKLSISLTGQRIQQLILLIQNTHGSL